MKKAPRSYDDAEEIKVVTWDDLSAEKREEYRKDNRMIEALPPDDPLFHGFNSFTMFHPCYIPGTPLPCPDEDENGNLLPEYREKYEREKAEKERT